MSSPPQSRSKIFISYSHADKRYLDRLLIHLRPLIRDERIEVWADTMLRPGDDWRKEIKKAIATAEIAIVLVSASFRASDFIARNELPPLLSAAKGEGMLILPVIVGACDYQDSELAYVQAVNDPSHPLNVIPVPRREKVWDKVVQRVKGAMQPPSKLQDEVGSSGSDADNSLKSHAPEHSQAEALRNGIKASMAGQYGVAIQLLWASVTTAQHDFVAWFEFCFSLAMCGLRDDAMPAFARAYNNGDLRQKVTASNDLKFPGSPSEYVIAVGAGMPPDHDQAERFPPLPLPPEHIFLLTEAAQRRVFSASEWESGAVSNALLNSLGPQGERWICLSMCASPE